MHPKSTQSLLNPTKYFCPTFSRTHVRFPSQRTYKYSQSKREGYESRLYWEYKYCEFLGGQTFFYTLTYNDNAIPKFEGKNCFDYLDLRYLLNGGFKKYLLRHFGTEFKYFVGAELGDGKGSRGIGNNPHYHVLFFLRPSTDPKFHKLYKKIHPVVFRTLVKNYWQGQEYIDYRAAKYGIAREGRFCGLVKDFRACLYVAKYCSKDVGLKNFEEQLRFRFESRYRFSYADSMKCYEDFVSEVINPDWNVRQSDGSYLYSIYSLMARFVADYSPVDSDVCLVDDDWYGHHNFMLAVQDFISSRSLSCKYADFVSNKIDEFVKHDINVYRNRYCNKCRISNGVGLYALDCLEDLENPKIKVPSKTGFKFRPLCLYYYRKLFSAIFKDKDGSVIYTLNSAGIDYRVSHLDEYINSYAKKVCRFVSLIRNSATVFDNFYRSEFNTSLFADYTEFNRKYNFLTSYENSFNVAKIYATYKIVYEDRFFELNGDSEHPTFPILSVHDDYRRFLTAAPLLVNRCDNSTSHFLEWFSEDYVSYSSHPDFYRYCELFTVFDNISDYFVASKDDEEERNSKIRESVRRFHSQRLFNESI